MTKKRNKNTLVLVAFIFTIIHLALLLFVGIAIATNLFGVVDLLEEIIGDLYGGVIEVGNLISSYYFDLILSAIVNISSAVFYYKGYKYRVNNPNYGVSMIFNGVSQLLFSGYIAGILAIIAGAMMRNRKREVEPVPNSNSAMLSDYKLTAMSEAVTRLKELRASGAITEEEYYENLNKILEG